MDFESALTELAKTDTKIVNDEETDEIRDEFDDTVHIHALRELIYALQSVSVGSQQLMYFAGAKYSKNIEFDATSFENVFERVATVFERLGVGRLELEEVDADGESYARLYESAFTFNGPEADKPACFFVSGFVAGALEQYTGEKYVVNETGCCAQGEESCTFRIRKA
ncbi:MAG: V4R domain-containing protein [Candidatus Nanohaloarchaea archaeon]|nr:V4R domain-containing protein [Candidatus Nanohaloarchaea archaeon]